MCIFIIYSYTVKRPWGQWKQERHDSYVAVAHFQHFQTEAEQYWMIETFPAFYVWIGWTTLELIWAEFKVAYNNTTCSTEQQWEQMEIMKTVY